jgi:uncharacterized protein
MVINFQKLFSQTKPVVACVHLAPLPGSPRYGGTMRAVYEQALAETTVFKKYKVDALIVENFNDKPFFPGRLPHETVAALAAVAREGRHTFQGPLGINALRNDGAAAMAIATASVADFIRVNVHMGAVVSEQGIIQGLAHKTLRLRENLKSSVLVFADIGVKHAAPIGDRGLATEAIDATERGLADALIVSGALTGSATNPADVDIAQKYTSLPVLIGSGATPDNLGKLWKKADGFIVGSFFKKDGKGSNAVEEKRVKAFMEKVRELRD